MDDSFWPGQGVGIEYALAEYPDTPEGRLNKHIRATVAEYEREKIVERMVRGQRNAVKSGSVLVSGRPPYGYRLVEDGHRSALVVYEPEAQVVRLIFAWYVEGDGDDGPMAIRAIAKRLSALRIPTFADTHNCYKKRGPGQWGASTVSQILKNETYAGLWRYGKRSRNDKGRWTKNPEEHCLAVEVPAIVDGVTWESVQVRLAENKAAGRRRTKHDYLLRQRLTCGSCGLKMVGSAHPRSGHQYLYYRCNGLPDRDTAPNCNAPLFRADHVDAAVWEWIKSFLSDPAALIRGLGQHQAQVEKENAPLWARLNVVNDLIANNEGQLRRLLDLYLSGDFSKEVLTDRKTRLEATLSALEHERATLVVHLEAQTLTPDQVQSLQDFAAKVRQGLALADADFAVRRRIIEDLSVKAVLMVEDGQKVIYASCILGERVCGLHPAQSVV